jgi:hypothetical protein
MPAQSLTADEPSCKKAAHALVHEVLAQGHSRRATARHLGWGLNTVLRYARAANTRYNDQDIARLLAVAWRDWPAEHVTEHVPSEPAADLGRGESAGPGGVLPGTTGIGGGFAGDTGGLCRVGDPSPHSFVT